jgi:hypothetical protein
MSTRPPLHQPAKRPNRVHTDTAATPFHRTHAWKQVSLLARSEQPICLDPWHRHATQIRATQATHHILSVQDYPELKLSKSNLFCLCWSCHSYVEALQRRGVPTVAVIQRAMQRGLQHVLDVANGTVSLQKPSPTLPYKQGIHDTTTPRMGVQNQTPPPSANASWVLNSAGDISTVPLVHCTKVPNGVYCTRMSKVQNSFCGSCSFQPNNTKNQ